MNLFGELLLAELTAFQGSAERPAAEAISPAAAASWERAKSAHPEIAIGPEAFFAHLAKKLPPETPPKILDYSGQGHLRSWYRVALVRALLDEQRRLRGEPEASDDERILGLASAERDPELQYLREKYTHEFRQAFEEGARLLEAEDRNALRAFYSQGLTIDQLAAMFGIHRATAARRVASARERLLANTRRVLMTKLQLSRAELESVMRLIESGLSLSVHRIFL